MPFFSVVIPLYNKEAFIEETLKSVLNQSFQDFEIIIIDDGSTDDGLERTNKFKDSRIKIYSQNNQGLSSARNSGIKKATANFIAFLDADDLWKNDYLECINHLIENYDKEFVFATNNHSWFNMKPPDLKVQPKIEYESYLINDYFSFCKNIFSYSSIVFHKSIFDNIGYFNEAVNHGEEEEFTIRCFLKFNLVYTNEKKVFYLKNVKNQLTAPNKNRKRIIPNYELYCINNPNKNLKKYINFIHFKLLVLYKMERNHHLVKFYKKKINVRNLSLTQKVKYHLPTRMFNYIKSIYIWFSNTFIYS